MLLKYTHHEPATKGKFYCPNSSLSKNRKTDGWRIAGQVGVWECGKQSLVFLNKTLKRTDPQLLETGSQ